MNFLKNVMLQYDEFNNILNYFKYNRFPVGISGLSDIHKSHFVYSICKQNNKKGFIFVSSEKEAQKIANDISSMGLKALVYQTRDFNFRNIDGMSKEYEHQRIKTLYKILKNDFDIIISCMDAALQYTIPYKTLNYKCIRLFESQLITIEEIINTLISCGYEKYDQVDGIGQFSVRGGILDFFSLESGYPVRIEFWGDEIDTIFHFDPETQRRTDRLTDCFVVPVTEVIVESMVELSKKIDELVLLSDGNISEKAKNILQNESENLKNSILPSSIDKFIPLLNEKPCTLFDYIKDDDFIFISEPTNVAERLKANLWQRNEDIKDYLNDGILCSNLCKYSEDITYANKKLKTSKLVYLDTFLHNNYDIPLKEKLEINATKLDNWNGSLSLLCAEIKNNITSNTYFAVLAGTKRHAASLTKDLISEGFSAKLLEDENDITKGIVNVFEGSLSSGFQYSDMPFYVVSHGYVNTNHHKKKVAKKEPTVLCDLSELSVGDYVVHSLHGIGMFDGIHKMNMHGITKDYIKLRYAKGDTLYLPVTQLDMISKYIGPKENARVSLHKLGGSDWQRTKKRVKAAIKDMAKELIKLYSARTTTKGHAFASDNEWQHDFESHFEHEETKDQLKCIKEIKQDMERSYPMDRLLCGDVGFGKTEVALRAAFKCVSDSKQCAILVPTTILALQHYQTACKRFERFPVRIELLSRFKTPKQQLDILKRLERGEIDLIIGTHRLVQKDVVFRDLGLVIIDEEQRFGVAQKERFKKISKNVDILTLSATPIPRTLNMAMTGIRDMSALEEAPGDRYPVQTYVLEYDYAVICEAIRRELRRGGQVYYLYNKIDSIERVAASISNSIPEANVAYGHGRMSEDQVSKMWEKMLNHEINVLVCTTIIETGIDLPNVNTIIIENADNMGLSQLHQIRGRVGRSSRRAYAYLTFRKNKVLSEISQKRLSAIKEFTEFGSGFKIAMRDLELRGAGNVLGAQQHGHMEDVGYDMYLKMLSDAVNEEKGQKVEEHEIECLVDINVDAHIPQSYIKNLNVRLDIYRRISDIRTPNDASDIIDELIDRFGDPPFSVKSLVDIALIRNTASALGIYEIKEQNGAINLYRKKIDMKTVSALIHESKYKIMVNAGSRPYISVKLNTSINKSVALQEILNIEYNITKGI